ncbi:unnamed protein product [Taenia asiatica]|uniref:Zinc finger protein n=1 Tax=Taenia asiatica TaxID=60517 RepID=A0A0R3W4G5_TAEAS|nr:unnamed protein product [Taenia asiatica]
MGTCPQPFAQPVSFGTLIARYSPRQSILQQPSRVGLQTSDNPSPMYHVLPKIPFCTRKNSATAITFNITKRASHTPTSRLHQGTANGNTNDNDSTGFAAFPNGFRNEEVIDEVRPKWKCQQCGKTYICESLLRSHKQSHSPPWNYHFCGKAFASKWSVQGHKRTHKGEKPFVCPTCERSFADLSNLQSHKQTHLVVKRYHCPHCSATFSRSYLLKRHLEKCSFSKPARAAIRKDYAVGHERTHSGEQPFVCPTCQHASLRAHMQVHRVVRSWRCPHCFASFSHRSLLSRHLEKCLFPTLATASGTRDVSIIYPVSTAYDLGTVNSTI